MMEKGIKYCHAMSDPALLELLGKFIQQTRLQQNKTQQQMYLRHNNSWVVLNDTYQNSYIYG